MIEIQGIGFYDETKSFNEQDEPVNTYLQEIVSTFNDMTAIERDQWNRPTKWRYDGEGVIITVERTYLTEDGNYFLKEQTYKVIENGNL